MPSGKTDVFISYSRADKDTARRLTHDLESAGIDVWYDEFQLKAGDPILHSIREAIERANVLLVLVSANSIESKWVNIEVREAFEKRGYTGVPAIIPIRIDSAEPPPFLQSIRYVDLRADYDEGLRQLLRVLEAEPSGEKIRNVIDTSGLAEALAKDRKSPRGAGFYVTTVLSILTIIATMFAAWPTFMQAFGDRPKLFYSITHTKLAVPQTLDDDRIRTMLRDEGIPDSNVRIQMINRGSKDADEIKVGVTIDGSLSSFTSDPDAVTNPVWVAITPPTIQPTDKSANLLLNDLVPNRMFSADYAYHADSDDFTCDVVVDGLLANKVADVTLIPEWSLWQEIKTPVLILVLGLTFSVVVGVFAGSFANKKFRELALEVVDVVSPLTAKLLTSLFMR
ncbi:MAG: hypothetical protein RhofKO_25590 [Rhodothermales bacterium]